MAYTDHRRVEHRCLGNVANRAAASVTSYRPFGIVPMVRRRPTGYGDDATGVRFSRTPSSICIRHERRSNERLRIVRRDRFRIAYYGMQRSPKHVVADDAAKWVQHVAVDAVQPIIQPFWGHGVVWSIWSILVVIPVVGCTPESTQLRSIVG